MGRPEDYFGERAKEILSDASNLVLIVADENGRINWNGETMTPFTFIRTFLHFGGFGIPIKIDSSKYRRDNDISTKIFDEGYKEMYDPLKQIEIRKKGLEAGWPINLTELKYYYDPELKKGGYFLSLSDCDLEKLSKAKIEYVIKSKEDETDKKKPNALPVSNIMLMMMLML